LHEEVYSSSFGHFFPLCGRSPPFLFLALLGLAAPPAPAQSNDPSDFFPHGILPTEGGKAEGGGNPRAALAHYRQAVAALNQISEKWPDWQPPLVKVPPRPRE
jgi:hypothetical protein